MNNFGTILKILTILLVTAVISAGLALFGYLKLLPFVISNEKVINYVENFVSKSTNTNLEIQYPVLKTKLNQQIFFKVHKVILSKDEKSILDIENLELNISFKRIFKKQIELKRVNVDKILVDTNSLISLLPHSNQPTSNTKNNWSILWLDSLMSLKECIIFYNHNNTKITVDAKNVAISNTREPKAVRFDLKIDINKLNNYVKLAITDNNKVYIKNHKLIIDKTNLAINNSNVFIDAIADEQNNFNLNIYSKNFRMKNVIDFIKTDLIVPNSEEILAYFSDFDGGFDFLFKLNNNGIDGTITVNKIKLNIIPVANLPVLISNGKIKVNNTQILLNDFSGIYGTDSRNKFQLNGSIDDYTNSVDTNIELLGKATNDLTENYISKLIGAKLTLTGITDAKAIVKSKYNIIDLIAMFKIHKGDNILIQGASISPVDYDRALYSHFGLDGSILDIKSIQYFIANELNKNTSDIQPLLNIDGQADINTLKVHNIGFEIPKPLPSEFLNVFIGQKVFKNGQITGNMDIIFKNNIPKMQGNLAMNNVIIPAQRMSIKEATLTTDNNLVKIDANGRFKRSDYKFSGRITNELIFPIIVKDINLTIDDIDIEKILISMSQQTAKTQATTVPQTFVDTGLEDQSQPIFVPRLLVVEKCILNVVNGVYKDIHFGNLFANLTLNKKGILEIKSNRFDFAEGISTLKVWCDLVNQKYNILLGAKDINADLLASTILNLPKEITGKATGLIELNTDETLKLNGRIQFNIKDGSIQKVGLVQYALNLAALFRNPMAMLSPSLIIDAVNIPDGSFDKINGTLTIKDNIVEKMIIKSFAPQLSAFIIGRYDLNTNDASLRIYTKFSGKNKGIAGFLRNISLNSLANKISLGNKNNTEANYYALELQQIPEIENEEDSQVFLTKVEGDLINFNMLSSLKKIK